ncbi:MAG: hypothetical protein HY919_02940 [Elusimicrobia bacterium]|nr:hypothetical protein [Elusimicrobiota bacterium]
MLNNILDIQTEFLTRGARTTSSADISDAILNNWTRECYTAAASFKKWPFTEGRISTTFTSVEEWSFEGYRADSFRLMQIGGKRLQKLNFEDYQIFKEKSPSSEDRVYSDFGNLVFINPNIDLSGTLTAWGHYVPAVDPTDKTAKTVFSDNEETGNDAIVELMLAKLKERDKLFDETIFHQKIAAHLLDNIWKQYQDEQFVYQTHTDRGGMFERFDVLGGSVSDEILNED